MNTLTLIGVEDPYGESLAEAKILEIPLVQSRLNAFIGNTTQQKTNRTGLLRTLQKLTSLYIKQAYYSWDFAVGINYETDIWPYSGHNWLPYNPDFLLMAQELGKIKQVNTYFDLRHYDSTNNDWQTIVNILKPTSELTLGATILNDFMNYYNNLNGTQYNLDSTEGMLDTKFGSTIDKR